MKDFRAKFLGGFIRLLSLLPLKVHYILCAPLVWLAKDVLRYRRKVVMQNLTRSFPDKSPEEIRSIARHFYRHLGDIIAETIWYSRFKEKEALRKTGFARFDNPEVINEAYRKAPSVMVMMSHAGNWETSGGWFAYTEDFCYEEKQVAMVYKRLSSDTWEKVFSANRVKVAAHDGFEGYVEHIHFLRYVLGKRDSKMVYLFPTDQFPYKGAKRYLVDDFMHQPTYTMCGGAHIASKLGMAVVYMGVRSESRGHYRLHLTSICDDASQMTPEEIMNKFYRLLQKDIEAQPWNYLWSHKRWK